MKIGIMCGSYEGNLESTRSNNSAAELITSESCSIVMGSGEKGTMGSVKEIVRENGRELIAIGNFLELKRTIADYKIPVTSTFERLDQIYKNSDIIVFLEGGSGTLSEFISFFNNKIEVDDSKPLILYNPNGIWNFILSDLEQRKKLGLLKDNYKLYFDEAKNMADLEKYLTAAKSKIVKEEERTRVR